MDDYTQTFDTFDSSKATVCHVKICLKAGSLRLTKFSKIIKSLENVALEEVGGPKCETSDLGRKFNLEQDTCFMNPYKQIH